MKAFSIVFHFDVTRSNCRQMLCTLVPPDRVSAVLGMGIIVGVSIHPRVEGRYVLNLHSVYSD